jgi:hypothetical protein
VVRAFELMLDERCSPREAADRLNAEGFTKRGARWTSRNLIQTLSRSTLDGRFVYGEERRAKTKYDAERFGVKGWKYEIPRVVPADRFAAMQELLSTIKWTKKTSHKYPLSRRITTPDGHTYTGRFDTRNRKRRYRCREKYEYCRPGVTGGAACSHKEISADKIEHAVWNALMSEVRSGRLEEVFGLRDHGPTEAEAANERMEQLQRQVAKLRKERVACEARGLRQGTSRAAIETVLNEIDRDIETNEAELASAQQWAENAARLAEQREVLDQYQEFAMLMNTPDEDLMQRVFEAFDVRVVLTGAGEAAVHVELSPNEYLLSDRRATGRRRTITPDWSQADRRNTADV